MKKTPEESFPTLAQVEAEVMAEGRECSSINYGMAGRQTPCEPSLRCKPGAVIEARQNGHGDSLWNQ